MTRDIIDINDFTILVEEASSAEPTIDVCSFDEPVIAVVLYGSGNVDLRMKYGDKEKQFNHTRGLALSFYADPKVACEHHVSAKKPLQCIVIATATRNLNKLPNHEGEIFSELLNQLVNPADHFVMGPSFFMSPQMLSLVEQVFSNTYEGKTKMMFFRSQMTTLLAHYFGQLSSLNQELVKPSEREKLFEAKEILTNNLETPPSLTELSRQIGLNSFNLKKNFKELFGVPVFKYLQNQRLTKAYDLIRNQEATVQEAAWNVGYDSLSSFSNAFAKKYGFRPSQIRQ
ncbi:MAG: helix-turn-helix transcriptional regulator [Flavobacteriaceae bacterium]